MLEIISTKVNKRVNHIIIMVKKLSVKTPYKPKNDKDNKLNNVEKRNKLKPNTNQGYE